MREADESKVFADKKTAFHSSIIMQRKHSYGLEHMRIFEWDEVDGFIVGSFNSILPEQLVFLGGNYRTDWLTTYPFGHIQSEVFPHGPIR
jgi:hypothetical protein